MSALSPELEALRANGDWRADPARFRFLEALARRAHAQPEPVRRLVEARLQAAIAEYVSRHAENVPEARRRTAVRAEVSPLGELNRTLRQSRPDAPAAGEELASARRFRKAWDAQRALQKLELALARKPEQPGPLNSHALLLQSLELMRALSPQYLRHFLVHAETLLWLGETTARPKPARARTRK
jgi:hypothetical protein